VSIISPLILFLYIYINKIPRFQFFIYTAGKKVDPTQPNYPSLPILEGGSPNPLPLWKGFRGNFPLEDVFRQTRLKFGLYSRKLLKLSESTENGTDDDVVTDIIYKDARKKMMESGSEKVVEKKVKNKK